MDEQIEKEENSLASYLAIPVSWVTLYALTRNHPKQATILSTIHSAVSALSLGYCIYTRKDADPDAKVQPIHKLSFAFSIGYYLQDMLLAYNQCTKADIVHHIGSLCGLIYVLALNTHGPPTCDYMCSLETSTVFLGLKTLYPQSTLLKLLFALAFFFCRWYINPKIFFKYTVTTHRVPYYALNALLHGMNLYWGLLIVRTAYRTIMARN